MMSIERARLAVFGRLSNCPVCGADLHSAEKSDVMEKAYFACGSSFFLVDGLEPSVADACTRPSHVAVRGLEREALRLHIGKAVA